MFNESKLRSHIYNNRWQYALISIIFIIGFIMGYYKAPAMQNEVKIELLYIIENFLAHSKNGYEGSGILLSVFLNQIKIIVFIWFLGLTIIGLPLILAAIFYKGFALGFTVGFLLLGKNNTSLIILLISILPQNLVYIPLFFFTALIAINFSVNLIQRRNSGVIPLSSEVFIYTLLTLIVIIIIFLGVFIEAYLSPWLLGLIIKKGGL